jgi:hypothetical protein
VGNCRGAAADLDELSVDECEAQLWHSEILDKQPGEVWVKWLKASLAKHGSSA